MVMDSTPRKRPSARLRSSSPVATLRKPVNEEKTTSSVSGSGGFRPSSLLEACIYVCIYAPGTFFCTPVKPFVNMLFGSSYAIAYAHFRRDHSKSANLWAHVGCLLLQVFGNFAFLHCVDVSLGLSPTQGGSSDSGVVGMNLSSTTAAAWLLSLLPVPAPLPSKIGTAALLWASLALRSCFTTATTTVATAVTTTNSSLEAAAAVGVGAGVGSGYTYVDLALWTAPAEVWCYWLFSTVWLPTKGTSAASSSASSSSRPGVAGCSALLLLRVGLWYAIKQHAYVGALSNWLDGNDLLSGMAVGVGGSGGGGGLVAILGGGSCVGGAVVAILLALGALFRAPNNLPMVSHLGLCLWLPALLLDLPWVFFLSMSFLGAALQGVAHELTCQLGTLNQLRDPAYELAHTSFFPVLTLQALHHSWFGPHSPTAEKLGSHGDARSRAALGLAP